MAVPPAPKRRHAGGPDMGHLFQHRIARREREGAEDLQLRLLGRVERGQLARHGEGRLPLQGLPPEGRIHYDRRVPH